MVKSTMSILLVLGLATAEATADTPETCAEWLKEEPLLEQLADGYRKLLLELPRCSVGVTVVASEMVQFIIGYCERELSAPLDEAIRATVGYGLDRCGVEVRTDR